MNKTNKTKKSTISKKDRDDFLRFVIFLEDGNKTIAVFPFYHILNDNDFQELINNYDGEIENENITKKDFCLMYEKEFGWAWIYKEYVNLMKQAEIKNYIDVAGYLVSNKLINSDMILNENWSK
jgi:hypothetical protein